MSKAKIAFSAAAMFVFYGASLLIIEAFPSFYLGGVLILAVLIFGLSMWRVLQGSAYKLEFFLWSAAHIITWALFLFLEEKIIQEWAVFVASFITSFFFFVFSLARLYPPEYGRKLIDVWRRIISIYLIFVLSSMLFALFVFFRMPAYVSSLFLGLFSLFLVSKVVFREQPTHEPRIFWTNVTVFAIVFETSWVLHFLPLGYFVAGVVLAFAFFLTTLLIRVWVLTLTLTNAERNAAAVGGIVVLLSLVFGRWT